MEVLNLPLFVYDICMQETENINIKRQILKYLIFLVIVIGLTILAGYLTLKDNYHSVVDVFKQANAWYLVLVLGIVIISILLRSLAIRLFALTYVKKYSFHRSIALDQVGTLYRMITPAGIGGHVMETYTYKKQGVSISNALSMIAMYSIVYQFALLTYNLITIIAKFDLIGQIGYVPISFASSSSVNIPLWVLILIGFVFNCAVVGFIYLLSFSKLFYRFVDGPILSLLFKCKIFKDKEIYHQKLANSVDNFRKNLKHLFSHWPTIIFTFVIFMVYITISYSIPYIVGLSLNNISSNANFWDSVLLSNFHQMITSIVPIPGNSLLSELFFLKLFYPSSGPKFYESEQMAKAALLLWRTLMFIIPLAISCIYTLVYRPRKEENINK